MWNKKATFMTFQNKPTNQKRLGLVHVFFTFSPSCPNLVIMPNFNIDIEACTVRQQEDNFVRKFLLFLSSQMLKYICFCFVLFL